jgi:hypothetical protein
MSVTELLRWASSGVKTGTLEIEQGRTVKRIAFRDGEIVGCTSDDPSNLLGQYLLSRGKISEDILRSALRAQELTGTNLGQVLVEMGILTQQEVDRFVTAKAEEMLFGLFDFHDGVFRFEHSLTSDPAMMAVHLRAEELLERGDRLREEMNRIRGVLGQGAVPCHSNHPLPPETAANSLARRLYDAIDGKKTIAEIILHTRASEFLAMKVLFQLYERGALKIREVREVEGAAGKPEAAVQLARQLVARGDYESALDALDGAYRVHRGNEAVRRMIPKVEAVFVESTYRADIPPKSVPELLKPKDTLMQEDLSPAEFFLISTIENGSLDVKSITWVAPMREVEVLRMVKRLLERGVIELRLPVGEPSHDDVEAASVTSDGPSIN